MPKFNIRIVKNSGDVITITDPYKIEINEDAVIVDYEDKSVYAIPDHINEIIIEVNH